MNILKEARALVEQWRKEAHHSREIAAMAPTDQSFLSQTVIASKLEKCADQLSALLAQAEAPKEELQ